MGQKCVDEGDLRVLQAISEHAEAASNGKDSEYRPWLLALGGGIRGIYGAAAAMQLEAAALTEGFEGCIGISTGAATCAYFLSKQAAIGTTIYYEECVGNDFFSPLLIARGGSGVNLGFISRVMRGEVGLKRLDQERIRDSRAQFYVAVSDPKTGTGSLIDVKKSEPDMVQAIEASMMIPDFIPSSVRVGGKQYVDGGVGLPFPAQEIVTRFNPTHILVLANRPERLLSPHWYRALIALAWPFLPSFIKKAATDDDEHFAAELLFLRSLSVPYLILWTSDTVPLFTRNKRLIRKGMAEARSHMRALLERAGN